MKSPRPFALALPLALLIGAGCSTGGVAPASSYLTKAKAPMPSLAALPDGTYSGSASVAVPLGSFAMIPRAAAEVTIASHAIAAVKMTSPKSFPGGTGRFEELASRVVAAQTTDVDAVSGASFTSRAFLLAIDKALTR